MGLYSYQDYQKQTNNTNNQNKSNNYIGYFNLKGNGCEALVKFMYDSPAEFQVADIHPLQINGKWRKISCLNGPHTQDQCPLCMAGDKAQKKFFIKLIHYTKDENGNVVATPKIWERSTAYIQKLRNYFDEYGPLSENVFKIRRNGEDGSTETKYDIMYANPMVYKPEIYVKTNAFDNYDLVKNGVITNKTASEMTAILDPSTAPAPAQAAPTQTTPVEPVASTVAQPNQNNFNQPRRTYQF